MDYALQMARQAVQIGTDALVATPHLAYGQRRTAPADWVREHVRALQAALNREQIPLRVLPGVEIPLRPTVGEDLTAGTLLTLGDAGIWVLIEPPFDRLPPHALDTLRQVQRAGFRVVVAHPERNKDVQWSLDFVEACAEMGCAFQLTTGSLLGHFGPRAQAAAEAILAHASEWPLVLASDAHNLDERPTNLLAQARAIAAQFVGDALAQDMVDTRPRSFVTP